LYFSWTRLFFLKIKNFYNFLLKGNGKTRAFLEMVNIANKFFGSNNLKIFYTYSDFLNGSKVVQNEKIVGNEKILENEKNFRK
jgi:hypothetical protein